MALLGAISYDPGTAVTKSLATLIAMTAFDTTNLRLSFTVPSTGRVMWRIKTGFGGGTVAGGSILLGILQSTTVMARQTPMGFIKATVVAGDQMPIEATGIVTGLTPSASLTWDAAYGVELVITGASIRYGGPNDTTTSNAYGAINFEIWNVG